MMSGPESDGFPDLDAGRHSVKNISRRYRFLKNRKIDLKDPAPVKNEAGSTDQK